MSRAGAGEDGLPGQIDVGGRRPDSLYARFGKPVFDRVAALVLLLIGLPFLVLMSVVLAASQGVPVLIRDQRIGIGSRPFTMLRFRISRRGGDPASTELEDMSTLGRLLETLHLDHLPQLLNVLSGKMSLVGPRPQRPEAVAELESWVQQRHTVKPGLTGLWRVSTGGHWDLYKDNLHLDIQYVDQISFGTDLRILLETVFSVLVSERRESNDRVTVHVSLAGLALSDTLLWVSAILFSVYVREPSQWSKISFASVGALLLTAIAAQLALGWAVGLYREPRPSSALGRLGRVAGVTVGISIGLFWLMSVYGVGPGVVRRSTAFAAAAYQLIGAIGLRFVASSLVQAKRSARTRGTKRLVIFGAGDAGEQLARVLQEDQSSDLLPVAFLDDDPRKASLHPAGLPVLGGRKALASTAARYGAEVLIIAIPSAERSEVASVADIAQRSGLDVRILPRLDKYLAGAPVETADIRQLSLRDFLRRDEIDLDLDQIADYLQGKTVLVTGAGGSIGSMICEIVAGFSPARLLRLDHNENALHELELRLDGKFDTQPGDMILADVRDGDVVSQLMKEHAPDVVFHAAAHKHVPILEHYPLEAFKSNVLGTLNLLDGALLAGVECFVNISTDKAADPQNVLGHTKRIAERLTAFYAQQGAGIFMSTRFGNVLGSKGSVIPTWTSQIERGQPLTVTHPDVTRYFMTAEEAVQLVVQAGAVGAGGDVFVLDMGEPVSLVDLARRLAAELAPGEVPEIVFTGLRPGEKLHEVLAGPDERLLERPHPLLSRYAVPSLDPSVLEDLTTQSDPALLRELMAAVASLMEPPPGNRYS